MTTTETVKSTFAISKDHLKALRRADRICFDHASDVSRTGTGTQGQIRCIKHVKNDPFETERTVYVPAISTFTGIAYGTEARARLTCFEMLFSAAYDEVWQTIVGLLREGDEIELLWRAGEGNNYLARAVVTEKAKDANGVEESYQPGLGEKLYHDRLMLKVRRGPHGEVKYAFNIDDSVCPNNTARMIRGL